MSPPSLRKGRLAATRHAVTSELWPVPSAMVVLAVVLGVVLPQIDVAIDDDLSPSLRSVLFGGGASEARQVLSSIASGLITTVSLTFSLTVVVFQLASSQYSPRLLRLFPRDGVTRATLGLLAGTFVYSLTVLRTVREDGVPRLSVTLAYVATAVGVLLLVVFLGHVVKELRVETMLRRVHREQDRVVADLLGDAPGSRDSDTDATDVAHPPGPWEIVPTASSGFVVAVDEARLVGAARRSDLVVELLRAVGEHVTVGTPLARVTTLHDRAAPDDVADAVRAAVVVGYERTSAQDVGFGLQQLVDICARALSPGVNDPTTARNTIGHLAAGLVALVRRDLVTRQLRDGDGVVRLLVPTPGFAEVLEAVMAPIRTFATGDVVVVREAMDLLRDVAWNAPSAARRAAVAHQRDRLLAATRRGLDDTDDVASVEAAALRVTGALAGEWV